MSEYTRDIYITDTLKILASNTAEAFGGQIISTRYADIIQPEEPVSKDADEIIGTIKGKINGHI